MTKLDKLRQQNRKNRLEDKLRQQEYYVDIEELFDSITKTLNTNSEALLANSEAMQALQKKTLVPLEDNTNVLKALESQQQRRFLDDRAVTLKDDRGKTFSVDNDMIDILLLMGKQTNKQFE